MEQVDTIRQFMAGRRLRYQADIFLLMVFAVSRVIYYLLGVRFDARPLRTFFQILDPELLRHRLLQSLFYLHEQPPGFNLYLGVILKLFPNHYVTVFHILQIIMGAVICLMTYHVMRVCGVHPVLGFMLAAVFIISPGVVLFENFLLHEYLVVALLLAAAITLYYFVSKRRNVYAALFFTSIFLLMFVRSHFHLIYLVALLAALLFFVQDRRRTILLGSAILTLCVVSLYLKNWILFGSFASSTWMGMNMDVITSHQLTPAEAQELIRQGIISRVSLIDAGEPISAYASLVPTPPKTGVPVLDEQVTSTGATNFNNIIFLDIGRRYMRDGLAILRHYPRAYWRSVRIAWFAYFLPTGDFPFFDMNRPRIYSIDRFFNVVFFGQWRDASDRKGLRAMEQSGSKLGLVLFTGTFLMIGLPLLWISGIWYVVSGVRRNTLDQATALLLGFMLFNITFLTCVANFLSSFENNRYRFQVDAFYVVLLGVALEHVRRRMWRIREAVAPKARTL